MLVFSFGLCEYFELEWDSPLTPKTNKQASKQRSAWVLWALVWIFTFSNGKTFMDHGRDRSGSCQRTQDSNGLTCGHCPQHKCSLEYCHLELTVVNFTISLPKTNLTKPRKLLNPELSKEIWKCDHSNESSWWVHSNGTIHVVAEKGSSFMFKHGSGR